MRSILTFIILLLSFSSPAQPAKQKRIAIGDTGCSYVNYCDVKFKMDRSADSSKVYSSECENGGVVYGIIHVQLKSAYDDLDRAEEKMIAYINYLRGNFTVTDTAGYTRGFRLPGADSVRGVTDYWSDAEGDKWKIRGWTDGKQIGFMYSYSGKPVVEAKVEEYFNGFRFPK